MNKSWWYFGVLGILGLLLGAGILVLVSRPPRGAPVMLLPAPTSAPILVHVDGAVKVAGLYTLPPGSRVDDAIRAAGGFSSTANTHLINLAKFLVDGEQVYVPENTSTVNPGSRTSLEKPPTGLVDINSATIEQLDTLPEIGPKTAENIIAHREANGPFASVDDILDVPGIGQVIFDRIKHLITVGTTTP